MTNDQLAEIEGRLKAATPGPWHKCRASGGRCSCGAIWNHEQDRAFFRYAATHDGVKDARRFHDEDHANIDLIANAPTDIAALLAEVRRLRAELAKDDPLAAVKAYEAAHGGRSFTFRRGPNIFSWSGATAQEAWANAGKPPDEFGSWSWYEIGHEVEP